MKTEEALRHDLPESERDMAVVARLRPARWKIVAEFLLFGFIFAADPYVQVISTFSWGRVEMSLTNLHSNPPPLAVLAVGLLWLNGGLSTLNFTWPANWKRCLWQLGVVLVLGFLAMELFARMTQAIWGAAPEAKQIFRMIAHPEVKYVFFFLVFPLWAVAEEVLYRAYFLQRIELLAKPWRFALPLAVFGSSALFALRHLNYGVRELPYYVFGGVLYSLIFLYTKRSIWFVSVIHYLKNSVLLIWFNLAS